MAGMKTLIQLMNNCPVVSTAQTCLVRAKVVKIGTTVPTKGANGEDVNIMNFSLGDSTEAVLANCSDETKFSEIVEGRTLHLRNFSIKSRRISLGTKARVMQGPVMTLHLPLPPKAINLSALLRQLKE